MPFNNEYMTLVLSRTHFVGKHSNASLSMVGSFFMRNGTRLQLKLNMNACDMFIQCVLFVCLFVYKIQSDNNDNKHNRRCTLPRCSLHVLEMIACCTNILTTHNISLTICGIPILCRTI